MMLWTQVGVEAEVEYRRTEALRQAGRFRTARALRATKADERRSGTSRARKLFTRRVGSQLTA
jgi:hypothetical protein